MSDITDDRGGRTNLRQDAQQKLLAGVPPSSRSSGLGIDALALLHRLASTPASAADALKLLHELQVHQVELDLQQAQLEANERELGDELARYRALYAWAPIAFFVLDARGRIEECNRAGADLLVTSCSEVCGRRFDEFLAPDSLLPLAALLRDVRAGVTNPCRTIRPERGATDSQRWRITAGTVPESEAILLVVIEDPRSPDT